MPRAAEAEAAPACPRIHMRMQSGRKRQHTLLCDARAMAREASHAHVGLFKPARVHVARCVIDVLPRAGRHPRRRPPDLEQAPWRRLRLGAPRPASGVRDSWLGGCACDGPTLRIAMVPGIKYLADADT